MIKEILKEKQIKFEENAPLFSRSTFRTEGYAALAFSPESEDELCEILSILDQQNEKYYVIGRGSNILFPDGIFDGALIFTEKLTSLSITPDGIASVGAGCSLNNLALEVAKLSLSGLEFVYGIPGSVGGAVFMNAGAYEKDVSSCIVSVKCYDSKAKKLVTLSKNECHFSYRDSIFQHREELCVLSVEFQLSHMTGYDSEQILDRMRGYMDSRRQKQPLEYPSAGSTFKRPLGHFAGKLIEDAGLKGLSVGAAEVSEKHAGFIVNKGGASSGDIKALIDKVRTRVFDKFGVMLECEVRFIE